MNWFKKRFGEKPNVNIVPTVKPPVLPRITLEDWQKRIEGISEYRALYQNPKFQEMLSVLHTIRPRGQKMAQYPADYQLGFIAGYEQALTTMFKLTEFPQDQPEVLVPDFGAEEVEKGWK